MARIPDTLIDAIVGPITDEMSRIRTEGIGSNFTVLDPADGYRKNNQVWFGTCATCGESVTSSRLDKGVWMHSQASPSVIPGVTGYSNIDHCPAAVDG